MAVPDKSRFWRLCRIAFRRIRICAWLLILALLGALLYLNQVGLPGFVKEPLLQKLRARGLDLKFTRLRWRWDRGIVAEDVHFGGADPSISPTLTIEEVQLRPHYPALARLQFQVEALILRQGRLTMPIAGTNAPRHELCLSNIHTELRLLPADCWELNRFQAQFADGDIRLAGTITNASAFRNWRFFKLREHAPPGALQQRLRDWAERFEQIHFAAPPHLNLLVRGDARDSQSFTVEGRLNTPHADTPWGTFQEGLAHFRLFPTGTNKLSQAEIAIEANSARTPWTQATNLILTLHLIAAAGDTNVVRADLDLAAARVETKWYQATQAHLTSQWVHSQTNAIPLSGQARLELKHLQTRWGTARNAQLNCHFFSATNALPALDGSWAWWTNLVPYALDWEGRLTGWRSPRLEADELACAGWWRAPELNALRIFAQLYSGTLNAEARLIVPTRELSFIGSSDFDVHGISKLLTEKSQQWLTQYAWAKPPELEAQGTLTLPAWTNRHPDWRLEVKPTVRLSGHFHIDQGTFRGVQASTADSHFVYSNEVWRLPDLVITRPEGRLDLVHEADERTRDYFFRVHSAIDVRALRPLFEPKQAKAFDLLGFAQQPPVIEGEVWGRWYEPERIGVNARVALTNFTLRGEAADGFQATLEYTNRFLRLIEPRLQRADGTQRLAVEYVGVDFEADKVYLTNGFGTADPLVVARAIGPRVGRDFEPYRFPEPPTVAVNGVIPMHGEQGADLHVDVTGRAFEWWKFKVPRITGRVDWVDEQLALRHVQVDFYHGAGMGKAEFNFHTNHGSDFRFNAVVTNADLHLLMADLSSETNRLEGMLTGWLAITDAKSGSWQSWQGRGSLSLRDGLIWEIPIFGIVSPVLDAIMPGLGNSRASEGSATFAITNGVINSDNLEIQASMMRLQYWGKLDLRGRVDAHAEAELLRDTWIFGRFLSLALWPVSKLFEYHITGTLREPKSEPIFFIPKLILLPLHPIQTFKDLVREPPDFTQTNAPPTEPP